MDEEYNNFHKEVKDMLQKGVTIDDLYQYIEEKYKKYEKNYLYKLISDKYSKNIDKSEHLAIINNTYGGDRDIYLKILNY